MVRGNGKRQERWGPGRERGRGRRAGEHGGKEGRGVGWQRKRRKEGGGNLVPRSFLEVTGYVIFSEATLDGCHKYSTLGTFLWTAGQRVDPSRNSTFVWRVKSTDTYIQCL